MVHGTLQNVCNGNLSMKNGNEAEKKTLSTIIRINCRSVHGSKHLCEDCSRLEEYALRRVDHCVYGSGKPACKNCPVHCYSPKMREEIRKVMLQAGPGMLFRHPLLSLAHILREKRKINGMHSVASPGSRFRSKLQGINRE